MRALDNLSCHLKSWFIEQSQITTTVSTPLNCAKAVFCYKEGFGCVTASSEPPYSSN